MLHVCETLFFSHPFTPSFSFPPSILVFSPSTPFSISVVLVGSHWNYISLTEGGGVEWPWLVLSALSVWSTATALT